MMRRTRRPNPRIFGIPARRRCPARPGGQRLTILIGLAAAALMVASCSTDGGPAADTAADGGPAADTAADDVPAAPRVESTVPDVADAESAVRELTEVEAVAELLGIRVHVDNADYYRAMDARQRRQAERNELIARCMSDRRFEFVADDPDVVHGYYDGFAEERNTEAWIARYGFGITTLLWPQATLGDAAVGHPGRAPGRPAPSDPLESYLDSLDNPDQYWTALFGAEPEPETGAYASTSCAGVAARAVPDPADEVAPLVSRLVAELSGTGQAEASPVGVLQQRLAADDEVVAAIEAGAGCLADAELEFADELEARIVVWERRGALPDPAPDPDPDPDPDGDTTYAVETTNGDSGTTGLAPSYVEALADVQAFEVATAQAVWSCGVARPQIDALKTSVLARLLG